MKRVLIVEDDKAILRGLTDNLKSEHYVVGSATDGERGYDMAKKEQWDIIILDVMLPNMDGFEICRRLRMDKLQTPILMLTAKGKEVDKVLGLEIGADDYMTKPFSVRELLARVKALLRRQKEPSFEITDATFGDIYMNFETQEARKGKKELQLSAKEFAVLRYLLQREGKVVSRQKLLEEVWGFEVTPTTRTVDNYILSLRKKIESDPSKPKHLLTVHTAGYKFVK